MQAIIKTQMMKDKIIFLIICISFLSIYCTESKINLNSNLKLSLEKVFIEDTILFTNLSLKIRFQNNSGENIRFNFKKMPDLKSNYTDSLPRVNS